MSEVKSAKKSQLSEMSKRQNPAINELRQLITDEYMRGVPEFMLQQATDQCVESLRQHMKRFVATRAENPTHARELYVLVDETLQDLTEKMNVLIQDKLWAFMQQT